MKIILVSPLADSGLSEAKEPSHDLAYLAAYLRSYGYEVIVIDAKMSRLNSLKVVMSITNEKPQFVGITAMTPEILTQQGRLLKNAKNICLM